MGFPRVEPAVFGLCCAVLLAAGAGAVPARAAGSPTIYCCDVGGQPESKTIDASLWFIHVIDRYLQASQDEARVRQTAWPAVKQILDGYRHGTR